MLVTQTAATLLLTLALTSHHLQAGLPAVLTKVLTGCVYWVCRLPATWLLLPTCFRWFRVTRTESPDRGNRGEGEDIIVQSRGATVSVFYWSVQKNNFNFFPSCFMVIF